METNVMYSDPQESCSLEFDHPQLDLIQDSVARFKPTRIMDSVPEQYQLQQTVNQTTNLIASYDFRDNWGWRDAMKLIGNSLLANNARITSEGPYQGTHSLRIRSGGAGELKINLQNYQQATLRVMYFCEITGAQVMVRPPGYTNPETDDWYVAPLVRNTMYEEVSVLLPEPYSIGEDPELNMYTIRFANKGHSRHVAYFDCVQVSAEIKLLSADQPILRRDLEHDLAPQ